MEDYIAGSTVPGPRNNQQEGQGGGAQGQQRQG